MGQISDKLQKLIDISKEVPQYSTDQTFKNDVDGYVEKANSSSDISDEILFNDFKNMLIENHPIVFESDILNALNMFEAIEDEDIDEEDGDGDGDDIDIDNLPTDEEKDLALIPPVEEESASTEQSTEPASTEQSTEPALTEVASDIAPKEKILTSAETVKKEELDSNLAQIDKNLVKIKELDSNDELDDLFLKELGKKYLIEQELSKLGTVDEFSVENSIDSIFESKNVDKKFHINYNKTLSKFKKKFTKLNEAKTLFTKIVTDKIHSKLNENLEVVINDTNNVFSIYKIDGMDDKLCLKTNFELPDDFSELLTKEDGFYTFDITDIVPVISAIKDYNYEESNESYVLELDDNYVSIDSNNVLDVVDDVDDTETKFETYEEADGLAKELFESTNIVFNVRKMLPNPTGSVVVNSKLDNSKYFKLNENYVVKGVVLARKGYPVSLLERSGKISKFTTLNSENKNKVVFSEDVLFESKLEHILKSDYYSLMESVKDEDTILYQFRELFENKGKKLTFKRNVAGNKLYESAFVDDNNVISKEIGYVDEFEAVENMGDNTEMSNIDAVNFILDNEEDVTGALNLQLNSEIPLPTIEIKANENSDISNDLVDGQELKINTDVYIDGNGNITNFSNGGENELIFNKNSVVKYYSDMGVTADNGESWNNVPLEYLTTFSKKDPDSLILDNVYVISDMVKSVNAEFKGVHDVDNSILYEFVDLSTNDSYFLSREEVVNNVE